MGISLEQLQAAIAQKVEQASSEMQKLNAYLLNVKQSIESLVAEKESTVTKINALNGYLQAHTETKNTLAPAAPEAVEAVKE